MRCAFGTQAGTTPSTAGSRPDARELGRGGAVGRPGWGPLHAHCRPWSTLHVQVLGLEACTSLTRIDASGNALEVVDGLAAPPALRWLSLARNRVSDLAPLRGAATLEVLNVAHNALEGKLGVSRLSGLKALIANDNALTALGGLERCRQLNTLVLSRNALTAPPTWLAGAGALQKLQLSHNKLTDLGGALGCGGNGGRGNWVMPACSPACVHACMHFSGLGGASLLSGRRTRAAGCMGRWRSTSPNACGAVSPPEGVPPTLSVRGGRPQWPIACPVPSRRSLKELRELRVTHNQLKRLPAGLGQLGGLRILDAGCNPIAALADLEPLAALPRLQQLNLQGCPVAELDGFTERVQALLPRLQARFSVLFRKDGDVGFCHASLFHGQFPKPRSFMVCAPGGTHGGHAHAHPRWCRC